MHSFIQINKLCNVNVISERFGADPTWPKVVSLQCGDQTIASCVNRLPIINIVLYVDFNGLNVTCIYKINTWKEEHVFNLT